MSFIHRAFLYVTRKRAKSLLLFLLLLVVGTLVLSGTAIQAATATAQLNVRQALGGVFTLQQNTSDPGKWVSTDVGSYGASSYYGGAPLTEALADYIQSHVSGIRGYNATYTSYVVPTGSDGKILNLVESGSGSGLDSLLTGYGDFNSTVSTYASTNTAYDSFFAGGYLELTEGRHFTAKEPRVAIVSQALADLNHLKPGDRLTLRMSEFKASMLGYDAAKTCVEVEIVGLFQATAKSTASLSNWSMDNAIYTTLDAVRTARPDMGAESYERIQFYANDPGSLERIVKEVQALPELDPTDFTVSVDSSNVDAVTEPLANINRLVSILTLLVLAVGAAVLYLVLSTRIRERVHESGVLLSLGFSKWNITAQYLAEILMIAALALSLCVFTSGFAARAVGSQLLAYTAGQEEPVSDRPNNSKDGITLANSGDYGPKFESRSAMTEIVVSIRPGAIAGLYGIGVLIICAAVLMAALPVLRMRPREILSKMS